jgi:hypothetical protein
VETPKLLHLTRTEGVGSPATKGQRPMSKTFERPAKNIHDGVHHVEFGRLELTHNADNRWDGRLGLTYKGGEKRNPLLDFR